MEWKTSRCDAFRAVDVEIVEQESIYHFRSLTIDELQAKIEAMLSDVDLSALRLTRELRQRLLPALIVLKDRIPHGEWQDYLQSIGLKPGTFRMMRKREREAANDITALLTDGGLRKAPKRKPQISESAETQLLRFAKKSFERILSDKCACKHSKADAREFLDAYHMAELGEDNPFIESVSA